jgi:hypothetical protein
VDDCYPLLTFSTRCLNRITETGLRKMTIWESNSAIEVTTALPTTCPRCAMLYQMLYRSSGSSQTASAHKAIMPPQEEIATVMITRSSKFEPPTN